MATSISVAGGERFTPQAGCILGINSPRRGLIFCVTSRRRRRHAVGAADARARIDRRQLRLDRRRRDRGLARVVSGARVDPCCISVGGVADRRSSPEAQPAIFDRPELGAIVAGFQRVPGAVVADSARLGPLDGNGDAPRG
jgi:hypothetical protein